MDVKPQRKWNAAVRRAKKSQQQGNTSAYMQNGWANELGRTGASVQIAELIANRGQAMLEGVGRQVYRATDLSGAGTCDWFIDGFMGDKCSRNMAGWVGFGGQCSRNAAGEQCEKVRLCSNPPAQVQPALGSLAAAAVAVAAKDVAGAVPADCSAGQRQGEMQL